MNIACITHADFEGPGYYKTWANQNGHSLWVIPIYTACPLPCLSDFDFLLIMGGPQSILDMEHYAYLKEEIKLIQSAIHHQKHILGICLGAQLMSQAFGAQSMKSPEKEVGNFPLQLTPEGEKEDVLADFYNGLVVGHWHNDMPGVPEKASVLASSQGCPHQIVRFNERSYGFQCHMEFESQGVEQLVQNDPQAFTPGLFVQSPHEIVQYDYSQMNRILAHFLNRWFQKVPIAGKT